MGVLAVAPVLVSQLMSFAYSFPFIFSVAVFANLPAFAACVLVSCVAAACRPLRFRSRFVAIALCTLPQLVYWGYFGGALAGEPIKWGYTFAPWISAWLIGLGIAGVVLGIGHFTRYRPGLLWLTTTAVLAIAVVVFKVTIGFDELDYQLYVARNNPEQTEEFHDHSITVALDETIKNPGVMRYLDDFFYPADRILLRKELKKEIQAQLAHDRWPSWFKVPKELQFHEKKRWLLEQYNLFIERRPRSSRMPIALYYRALLSEYSPDYKLLDQAEILHFYSDHPFEGSRETWYRLYTEFGDTAESLEARWRIAMAWAGQGKFELAVDVLEEAQAMLPERLESTRQSEPSEDTLLSPFRPPAETVITEFKLTELQRKISQLLSLIGKENRTVEEDSLQRLAKFVSLNAHSPDYGSQLEELVTIMANQEPLRDNVLLAQAKLTADEQLRAEQLAELHEQFQDRDGGIQALYELALLKIHFWREQDESNAEQKKALLADARATLTSFLDLYPDSFCSDQVKKNLADLPAAE